MQKPADRLPPLDLLVAFEAAARHLSFTKAAQERFLTQSAMSRQMQALEDDLGVVLFRRGHRSLALTDAGMRLLAVCTASLAQLRATMRELRAPAQREVLSLTTTPGLAAFWLIPRLPSFTQSHPGIDVRLDTTFELRQLAAEGFDLAIRYGRVGVTEGLPLFAESAVPVCSPKLLRRLPLAAPQDLQAHTLLQLSADAMRGTPLEWEPWLQAMGLGLLQPAARLSFSSYNDVVAAAVAGQGVALGRRPLVDALLRKRALVAPLERVLTTQRQYTLLVDAAARLRPAVLALEGWLLAQASSQRSAAASGATTLRAPRRQARRAKPRQPR
jgi:LysR family transcriptional regulator, glycine cleavage system transcriptional activator